MNSITDRNSQPNTNDRANARAYRLVVFALMAAAVIFSIAVLYPSGASADESTELSFGAAYAMIASQSFMLTLPGLVVGLALGRWLPRLGHSLGAIVIIVFSLIVILDVLTFTWIGERFLSHTIQRILTTLLPGLALHVTRSTVIDTIVAIVVGTLLLMFGWWSAGRIGRRWESSRDPVSAWITTGVLSVVCGLISLPAIWNGKRTLSEMHRISSRHPFCAVRLVGYRGTGVIAPSGEDAVPSRLRGLHWIDAIHRLDDRQRALSVDMTQFSKTPKDGPRPDVVIIIAESLRHELIDPDIMPFMCAMSEKSIHARQHFSAGNSTSFGMFGMMTGLEAIWFDRPVANEPILNRLASQAGYVTGFFGGEDDWEEFGMDGYVREANFSQFEIEYPYPPKTDFRAVDRTLKFLDDGKTDGVRDPDRAPRLSITYLLNTHCRYVSEPQDRIFQPEAKEEFLIPYTADMVPGIYNRYKNSARTLDRMIKPLLRDDCIVVFIGDHGESFLEDGSAIHGLRLSRVQNMTPMVFYYPGVMPRKIESPTLHADILPTVLSILNIPVTDPDALDGCDLTTVDHEFLSKRVFSVTNFMDRSSGLIGPWTRDPEKPFAYRFLLDLRNWQLTYLNPIDSEGYEITESNEKTETKGSTAKSPDGVTIVREWLGRELGVGDPTASYAERDSFERFFSSSDRETRAVALEIASHIRTPNQYLYDLIANASRDPDVKIRTTAKDLIIRLNRSYVRR